MKTARDLQIEVDRWVAEFNYRVVLEQTIRQAYEMGYRDARLDLQAKGSPINKRKKAKGSR